MIHSDGVDISLTPTGREWSVPRGTITECTVHMNVPYTRTDKLRAALVNQRVDGKQIVAVELFCTLDTFDGASVGVIFQ